MAALYRQRAKAPVAEASLDGLRMFEMAYEATP